MKYWIVLLSIMIFPQVSCSTDPREDAIGFQGQATIARDQFGDELDFEGFANQVSTHFFKIAASFAETLSDVGSTLWPLSGYDEEQEDHRGYEVPGEHETDNMLTHPEDNPEVKDKNSDNEVVMKDEEFSQEAFKSFIESLNERPDLKKIDLTGCKYPAKLFLDFLKQRKLSKLSMLLLDEHELTYDELNELLAVFTHNKELRKVLFITPRKKDDLLYNSVMLGFLQRYISIDKKLHVIFREGITIPQNLPKLTGIHYPKDSPQETSSKALQIIEDITNGRKVTINDGKQEVVIKLK